MNGWDASAATLDDEADHGLRDRRAGGVDGPVAAPDAVATRAVLDLGGRRVS